MLCLCRFFTAPSMDVEGNNLDMKFSFAAEVYTHISAANILISCDSSEDALSSLTVKLHKDYLIVQVSKGDNLVHQLKVTAPHDFFIPVSYYSDCRGLTLKTRDEAETGLVVANYVNGNLNEVPASRNITVSFRVQINDSFCESDTTTTRMISLTPQKGVPYSLRCMKCKATFRDGPISFKKVAPEVDDEYEGPEGFFCHEHGMQDPLPVQEPVQAEDELLFSHNYYLLACLQNDRFSQDPQSHNVHCANCHSVLGFQPRKNNNVNRNFFYCFKDKVVFHKVDQDMSFWPSSGDVSLSILLDIIEKTLEYSMTCKLVLESKASPSSGKCLLLWVMSQNMKLFRTQQVGSSLDSEKSLDLEPFMKVLYQEAEPNSEVVRSWVHQFVVDHYYISDVMMQDIAKILVKTSQGPISPDQEMSSSLNMAYLPLKI